MKPKAGSKSTKLSPAVQKARKKEKASKDTTKLIASLCSRSRTALDEGDIETAHDLANRACALLPQDSTNVHPLELFGEIKVELGEIDQARELFLEAVKRWEGVSRESVKIGDEGKYAWLGQMSTEYEAEGWYMRAVSTLQELMERASDENERKLINAILRSFANISMTDRAEENAEKYASLALKHDDNSPTALSLLASIRLSQTRNVDAISLLEQSVSKWYGKPDVPKPSYPERINLVKLLLEVGLYENALEVLETLQLEEEENVELWYLYMCAYYHHAGDAREETWKNAMECGETCLKLYKKMEWDDEELRKSCQEMLGEIRKSGISINNEEEGEEEIDDGEWEDDSDVDVEMEDAT